MAQEKISNFPSDAEHVAQRDYTLYKDPLVQQLAYQDRDLEQRLNDVREAVGADLFPVEADARIDALQEVCRRKFLYPYDENAALLDKAQQDPLLAYLLIDFGKRRKTYFLMTDDRSAREHYEGSAEAVRNYLESQSLFGVKKQLVDR